MKGGAIIIENLDERKTSMAALQFKRFYWLALSLFVVVIDQITKHYAAIHLEFGKPLVIFSFFNLTLLYNTGAAYNFLASSGGWQKSLFMIIPIVVSGVLLVWLYRLPKNQTLSAIAYALIIGGALGNLFDRINFGYVIDFFNFHIASWHFAVFNVADTAISMGAILFVLNLLFTPADKIC